MKTKALYGFSPDLEPLTGKSPAEQVAWLQALGINAVFGGYQQPAFVDAAHGAGLRIFAEFGCFMGNEWWERVPACRPLTAEGRPLEPEGWYYGVNPAVPAVREGRLGALKEFLLDYAVDGVWLDFIRWPCHWEVPEPYFPRTSFDSVTLAQFRQDTGIAIRIDDAASASRLLLGRYEAEWTAWRCDQITGWVAEAQAVVQSVRPGIVLGLFGVPWRLADRDGAILNVIGQDYRALGSYVDVFSPMAYHRMCGERPEWIAEVTQEVHALSGKPVWPILQSVDEPAPLPAEEYGRALEVALGSEASSGVVVFTMQGAVEGAKLQVTRERLGGAYE
jgi:hypothetical protein